ncbi:hypothetical protein [Elizabethkingia meningoseptica]|uniref:hypothetical protein n=2 Tax=Elizabethkingia meningoseptica TaxID=238 RepID=UPI000B18D94A|nr:hypothetical protein [Elizabethkingia meningoseptica]
MKKILLLCFIMMNLFSFSQENCTTIKDENNYLKKILDINKPVSEISKDNTTFKIIKVAGDKAKRTVSFTLLFEAKDANKKFNLDDISIFDLEGNEIGIDFFKSDSIFGNLILNVPKKITLTFTYKTEVIEPKIIKLLKFKFKYTLESNSWEEKRTSLEFRDLNVNWN